MPIDHNRIKQLLDESRVSIADFSRDADISYPVALNLFKGRGSGITWETLEKLCHYFGLGPSELFPYHNKESRDTQNMRPEPVRLYDAGEKVRSIRLELNINNPGEFADLIGFQGGDREYNQLEKGEKEWSVSLLGQVSRVTGARLDWLKYGTGSKYLTYAIPFRYDGKAILDEIDSYIKANSDNRIFMVIDTEGFLVGAVLATETLKYGGYKSLRLYRTFSFSILVDFWQPLNDCSSTQIINFYKMLRAINRKYETIEFGRIFGTTEYNFLMSGEKHPSTIIDDRHPSFGHYWPDDILDLSGTSAQAPNYNKMYGDWFVQMQNSFRAEFQAAKEEKP